MPVQIRPAQPADVRFWHEVRNHPSVRSFSRSSKAIRVDEHKVWFADSLENKKRKLYVVLASSKPAGLMYAVGIARLDHRGTWTEISLALNQTARGYGIGKEVVRQLESEVFKLRWPTAGAVVNGKNGRSLRLFTKLGFVTKKACWIQLTAKQPKG